ncbi:Semaphorin-2A [Nymphon striatum]|nr:Semaphorin-2A [Nymphon striatum]
MTKYKIKNVRDLSCGKMYYKTFYIDPNKDVLYVGAMDKVYRLNLYNINASRCDVDSLTLTASDVPKCVSKGKSEHYDCKNHIRVIQPIGDGTRLYVCGTNAHNPMDWVIYSNLSHLGRHDYFPGVGNGIAKCPFDPDDNSTAVWVEKGNPDNLPGLYSGSVAEFTKADTVIFRTDLYNQTTGQRRHRFKRTIKYDSKWLDKPNFVGSYEIGDYVYFFFRETAVEFINCGKNIYSRVARVCKRDTGGSTILSKNWVTFLKARLNCSIPGEFPFYFNEIQSVYKMPNNDDKFYAAFTTSMNGLMGSAICTFSISEMIEAFNAKFKEQATSSSAWLPVLSSKVPEPRPGQCVNNTQTLPDSVLNFIRTHPLMDSAVRHDNEKPVYYKRDFIFTHIVVDRLKVNYPGIVKEYTIFYAGSKDGQVHKVVEWNDHNEQAHSQLLDVFDVTAPDPISAMEISSKHKSLYVASHERVRQIPLDMCKGRYNNCLRCIRDPYCGWDKNLGECRPFIRGSLQDVTNSTPGICDNCVKKRPLRIHWGQSIFLACAVNMPHSFSQEPIKWYHYSQSKGRRPVVYSPDKYIESSDHGLMISNVKEHDSGRYDCKIGASTLCTYNITVDTKTCNAPNEKDYRRIYSEWCHEFEKYKHAMKSWQTKQNVS